MTSRSKTLHAPRARALALAVLVPLLALAGACKHDPPPSRWDDAAAAAASRAAAPPSAVSAAPKPEIAAGGALNTFFPKDQDGATLTYSAEKTGYAEAKLRKDGKELGVLSISDVRNNPDAASKFSAAPDTSLGWPLVTQGKNQSAVLVAKRWQVKVSSPALDERARKGWLAKFDLAGLANLKPEGASQ
jgi:hypothetical protein